MRYKVNERYIGVLSNGVIYAHYVVYCTRWFFMLPKWRYVASFETPHEAIEFIKTNPLPYSTPKETTVYP